MPGVRAAGGHLRRAPMHDEAARGHAAGGEPDLAMVPAWPLAELMGQPDRVYPPADRA
jgi:hypothetical protein